VVAVLASLGIGAALLLLGSMTWRVVEWQRSRDSAVRSKRRLYLGLVHLGVAALVVGLTLSEGFSQSARVVLDPGTSVRAAGVTVHFQEGAFTEAKRYEAFVARIGITEPGRDSVVLSPELRAYRGRDDLNSELAVRTGIRDDLLVAIAKVSPDGRIALVVRRRPGVAWIWIGGELMALGGVALVLPRRRLSQERGARDEE